MLTTNDVVMTKYKSTHDVIDQMIRKSNKIMIQNFAI